MKQGTEQILEGLLAMLWSEINSWLEVTTARQEATEGCLESKEPTSVEADTAVLGIS
jgi:hypothetical protein